MTIKLLMKNMIFVVALILNASFLICSEDAKFDDSKKDIFEEFLEFRKLNYEVKNSYCSLGEEIKNVFAKIKFYFEDPILCHVLDDRFKCCEDEKQSLEDKLRSQSLMVLKARKAYDSGNALYAKKQEKKYLAKGGGLDDMYDQRLKKDCPEYSEIIEVYLYSHRIYLKFLESKIISSSVDFVSLMKFLDRKVEQRDEQGNKNSSCPVSPLELVNFFGFPEGKSFLIDLESLKLKVLSDMEKAFRKDFSEMDLLEAELFKHFRSSKSRALDLQKNREEKEQKEILKHSFFAWILPARERLEQKKKELEEEKKIKEQQKQLLFEKSVIEPNVKHAQQVESLREQRKKIVIDDSIIYDNPIKEYSSPVDSKIFELSVEQKQASKKAKFERRAYRRALSEAFEANSKHQELILLKKQDREILAQKELGLLHNTQQEPLLERKWAHNPYSSVVYKFVK